MSAGLEAGLSADEMFVSLFPVHRACRDGDLGALVSLVRHFSNLAHLTVEDSCCGWTPIHWAAHYGQVEFRSTVHRRSFNHLAKPRSSFPEEFPPVRRILCCEDSEAYVVLHHSATTACSH